MCKSNVVFQKRRYLKKNYENSGRFVCTKKDHAIPKGTGAHKHHRNMPLHAAIEALCNAHPASRLDLGGLLNADRAKPGNANVEVLCMAMRRHARHAAHTRRSQTNQGRERRRTHTTLGPLGSQQSHTQSAHNSWPQWSQQWFLKRV